LRLVALTYGTEGDTRPIAALCRALMDAGYGVTLLADGSTLGSARDLGVPRASLAGDIRAATGRLAEQRLHVRTVDDG
jgi:sterol 3beta-glucosyltransferase